MITYFSGTGNSRHIAGRLAALTADIACDITRDTSGIRDDDHVLGLVFPVYAWGLPRIYERFLSSIPLRQFTYIYMVCTCGDDTGCTDRILARRLKTLGNKRLSAAFSVRMPNTYIGLPGFDVDTKEIAQAKLAQANGRLTTIAETINAQREGYTDVWRGRFPRLKSYLLRPLFNLLLTSDKAFHTTDRCQRCGKCVAVCPLHNIRTGKDGLPSWQGHCATCLRCYHACPCHAIEYRPFGKGKGQYLFPENKKLTQ